MQRTMAAWSQAVNSSLAKRCWTRRVPQFIRHLANTKTAKV